MVYYRRGHCLEGCEIAKDVHGRQGLSPARKQSSPRFLQKVQILADAISENDLYALKSLHFEKLSGNRQGQRSIRLNSQFRLIFTIRATQEGSLAWIIEVVDYH